jgi:LAO/AO transport system kinase
MVELDVRARRDLAREITRLANARVDEVLAAPPTAIPRPARRIGFTGPPGVGKSTLVGHLITRHAASCLSVGVLAIDPASPYSRGAILGDRIRMEEASLHPHVFMRSVSSRDAADGMCNNAADILLALEARGFDEVLLETVGVGQAEHAVKALVDTVVLLMQPETGDAVQALKAGILEVADIIVISKSDLPGAQRMREHLAATIRFGAARDPGWTVPVLNLSVTDGQGFAELDEALQAHAQWAAARRTPEAVAAARQRYRVQDLVQRRLEEALRELAPSASRLELRSLYDAVVAKLATGAPKAP